MIIYIYKIYCIDESIEDIYIGSTNNIYHRLRSHKSNCYNIKRPHYNCKVYQFIREHGGFDNWLMEVIDEWDCQDGDKEQIEQLYISTCEPELNDRKSYMSEEETKEYNKQRCKQYNIEHKEKMKQYRIEYQLNNKEKKKI